MMLVNNYYSIKIYQCYIFLLLSLKLPVYVKLEVKKE